MSRNNRSSKLALRIICGLLAALMVLGGLVSIGIMLVDHAHAAEYPEDLRVHIGLKYASTMQASYTIYSESGFSVVNQNVSDLSMPYTEIFQSSRTQLLVAAAQNLVKTGDAYYATTATSADIGGYSLQINRQFSTYEQASQYITNNYASKLSGYHLYVAYESSTSRFRIRVDDYTSESAANSAATTVRSKIGDSLTVIQPNTSVYLIDPEKGTIVFAFGDSNSYCLGLRAVDSTKAIRTVDNWYDGTLTFKCAAHNNSPLLRLTNVMDLEPYIERVVVSEIYASWPLETQKAFAIAARTYTIANLNKHSRYGFDLCATTDCHVYDAARLYDRTHQAVTETAGQVISYEGGVASIYYSSSTGGVTVSAEEAFGPAAAKPYLVAIKTPWEKYTKSDHSRGFWRVEITPEQLASTLRSKGYTTIKDAVDEIRILKFAKDSTYVYQLEITDIHGNSILLETTEKVRIALGVNSANFVVGRGSVLYTTEVDDYVVEHPEAGLDAEPKFTVETADGNFLSRFTKGLNVIHSEGYSTLPDRAASVITARNVYEYAGSIPNIDADQTNYQVYHASDPNNFVFVGKGWGHGVGMSQWGLKDMGDLHYTYDQMLESYFLGAEIEHYTKLH